jgi:hypothetical protein
VGLLQVASMGDSTGIALPDQQLMQACFWKPEVVIEGTGITNNGIRTQLGHDECVPLGTVQSDDEESMSMKNEVPSGLPKFLFAH